MKSFINQIKIPKFVVALFFLLGSVTTGLASTMNSMQEYLWDCEFWFGGSGQICDYEENDYCEGECSLMINWCAFMCGEFDGEYCDPEEGEPVECGDYVEH